MTPKFNFFLKVRGAFRFSSLLKCAFVISLASFSHQLYAQCPNANTLGFSSTYSCSTNTLSGQVNGITAAGFQAVFVINNEQKIVSLSSSGGFSIPTFDSDLSLSGVYTLILSSVQGSCVVSPSTLISDTINIRRPLLTGSNPGIALEVCRSNTSLSLNVQGNNSSYFLGSQAIINWSSSPYPFGGASSTSNPATASLPNFNFNISANTNGMNVKLNGSLVEPFTGSFAITKDGCSSPNYPILLEVQPEPYIATIPSATLCSASDFPPNTNLDIRLRTSPSSNIAYNPSIHGDITGGTFNYSDDIGQGTQPFPITAATQTIIPVSTTAIVLPSTSSSIVTDLIVSNLQIEGSNTCAAANQTFPSFFTVRPKPELTSSSSSVEFLCHGEPYNLSNSFQLSSNIPVNYQYSFPSSSLTGLSSTTTGSFSSLPSFPITVSANNSTGSVVNSLMKVFAVSTVGNCSSDTITRIFNVAPVPDANSIADITICSGQPLSQVLSESSFTFTGTGNSATITDRFWKIYGPNNFQASGVSFPPDISITNPTAANQIYYLYAAVNSNYCSSYSLNNLPLDATTFICTLTVSPYPKINELSFLDNNNNEGCSNTALRIEAICIPSSDISLSWSSILPSNAGVTVNPISGTFPSNTLISNAINPINDTEFTQPIQFTVTPSLTCGSFTITGLPISISYDVLPGPTILVKDNLNNQIPDTVYLCSGEDIPPLFLNFTGLTAGFDIGDATDFTKSISVNDSIRYTIRKSDGTDTTLIGNNLLENEIFTDINNGSNAIAPINSIICLGNQPRDLTMSFSINGVEGICPSTKQIVFRVHPRPNVKNDTTTLCANNQKEFVIEYTPIYEFDGSIITQQIFNRDTIISIAEDDTTLEIGDIDQSTSNTVTINPVSYTYSNHLFVKVFNLQIDPIVNYTSSNNFQCASLEPVLHRLELYPNPPEPESSFNEEVCLNARNIEIPINPLSITALDNDSYYAWSTVSPNFTFSFDYDSPEFDKTKVALVNTIIPGTSSLNVRRISRESGCSSSPNTISFNIISKDAISLSKTCVIPAPGGTALFAVNDYIPSSILNYQWGAYNCNGLSSIPGFTGIDTSFYVNPSLVNQTIDGAYWVEVSDTSNCKSRSFYQAGCFLFLPGNDNARIDGCIVITSIENEIESEVVSLFPNPVIQGTPLTLKVNQETSSIQSYQIVDVLGRHQSTQSAVYFNNKEMQIPTSNLKDGLYFLLVHFKDAQLPSKTIRFTLIQN